MNVKRKRKRTPVANRRTFEERHAHATGGITFLLFLFVLLFSAQPANAASQCVLRTNCLSGETAALSLYQSTDSHIRTGGSGAYKICCPSYYTSALGAACSETDAALLNFYQTTDSHANGPAVPAPPPNTKLCLQKPDTIPSTMAYTSNDCRVRTSSCIGNELCALSLAQAADSHAAECGVYPNNVCCCPSGYKWDPIANGGIGACIPGARWCADTPHDTFYCGQPESLGTTCNTTDYSKCCLSQPAVTGADYSAWRTITPSIYENYNSLLLCDRVLMCGATNTSGNPDGICPETISNAYNLGFMCGICDSDCFGAPQCNGITRNTGMCDGNCNLKGPAVSVTEAPASWINTSWTARVGCAPGPGGPCNTATYRLKLYPANPNVCSNDYNEYNLADRSIITSYGFVCAAAKDTSGAPGFSLPEESLVDTSPPFVFVVMSPDPPATGEMVNFTATANDALSGVNTISISVDGLAKKTCVFSGNATGTCKYEGGPYTGSHTYSATANDTAGGANQSSVKSFTVSSCDTADFTIIDISPNPAQESTTVTITFNTPDTLVGNPHVNITPGIDIGYTAAYPAVFSSQDNGRYIYTFDVLRAYPGGRALVEIEGTSSTCSVPGRERGYFIISSKRMLPELQVIPNIVTMGDTTYAIFSCKVTQGSAQNACLGAVGKNTDITAVIIDTDDKARHDYMAEQGITNPDNFFHSSYAATNGMLFSNVWVFPINTATYHTSVTVTAMHTPSGLTSAATATYTVITSPIPSASGVDVKLEFPGVTNNIVPLTASGIPNFTRSMPVTIFAYGTIIKQFFGNEDCSGAKCAAKWSIDGSPYTSLSFDAFNKAFVGNTSSGSMGCDTIHTAEVNISVAGSSASGKSSANFFVSCEPRITVSPTESRVTVGDKGIKVFDVTIWNPRDTSAYELKMETVKIEDQNVLGWLDLQGSSGMPPAVNVSVGSISSATRTVYLNSNPGAGRSGAFGLRFTATNLTTGSRYTAFGNLLVFAEGLDEFPAWYLIPFAFMAVLIYYKFGNIGAKKTKARRNLAN